MNRSDPFLGAVRSRRSLVCVVAVAAIALGLTGCSGDASSIAAQAKAGDQKGYVSGNGAVEVIPAGKRNVPVELEGDLLAGGSWSSDSGRGRIVVLNVWGSWCAPCVAEAPHLQEVWEGFEKQDAPVDFMGIDFREDPARGLAFVNKMGVTYPSLSDESGTLILQLQGKAPTVPTTLVLDREGRIAARVNGSVDATTLRGLVDDAMAE